MTDRHILTPAEGISADGYITDQDCFSSVRYRGMRADINGCGWIAAYNLRHALGQETDWDEVRQEMDAMHTLRFPGPTLMRIMRNYLAKYVPDYRETAGREEAAQAAKESFAGIFRYQEGHEPHFISFVRRPDGKFRFFNVTDGMEDSVMSMEDFAAGHLLHGTVIALTADENTRERKDAP